MGLLDDLLGGLASGGLGQSMGGARRPSMQQGAGAGNLLAMLLPVVLSLLTNRGGPALGGSLGGQAGGGALPGGLGGLLEQLQRAGFGEQARSWVSTGQNLPISPDVIGQIFGPQELSALARQAGVSEEETSRGLSQLLPEVVDHLTPAGQVPDLGTLSNSVDDLVRRMGMRPE